tara:strand:- start:20679 stop:20891 length:213 start_codon:yes stop_codon:yes gene_type:complete
MIMARIDIRNANDYEEITEIQFGNDETLVYGSTESDLFYVRSEAKLVPVYIESIDNMIKALEQAKELWGE